MTDEQVQAEAENHVARYVVDHKVRAALQSEIANAKIVRRGRTVGMVLPSLKTYELPVLTFPELGVTILLVEAQEDLDVFFLANPR